MPEYKIIAVDFDGTLSFGEWPEVGEPNAPLIAYLKNWKKSGNKLILWTCRAGSGLAGKGRSWTRRWKPAGNRGLSSMR